MQIPSDFKGPAETSFQTADSVAYLDSKFGWFKHLKLNGSKAVLSKSPPHFSVSVFHARNPGIIIFSPLFFISHISSASSLVSSSSKMQLQSSLTTLHTITVTIIYLDCNYCFLTILPIDSFPPFST